MIQIPLRFTLTQTKLSDWTLIEVTGKDRETFFQGQVTNDVLSLSFNEAHLTTRLNRVGKIQSFFYLARLNNKLILLCQNELAEFILEDFNKFIIMDEVELKIVENVNLHIVLNPVLLKDKSKIVFSLQFNGMSAGLGYSPFDSVPLSDPQLLESIRILNGFPLWGKDINSSMFINDTILNELGISYKKGCFLGQETVAKIENNRGAAYYPVLLKLKTPGLQLKTETDFAIDGKKAGHLKYQVNDFAQALLLRDYRVEGRILHLLLNEQEIQATVMYLPYFKNSKPQDLADELYHLGVESFQKGEIAEALELMKQAIDFNPAHSDAYESIGVILGRKEHYAEALEWMDKLLAVKPDSVMAHTNKSLFLMKLGRIEEAEAEKGLATVKSFTMYGEEAKLKKAMDEEKKKKEDDINRREKMFLQVLELDTDDTIALYGLADVAFFRGKFNDSIKKLTRVIELDKKYSTAYLLLGKSYEAIGDTKNARQIYESGIEAASKQGDMMPANEMQSRLNQLIMSSRLI